MNKIPIKKKKNWTDIAKMVIDGKFDSASDSTKESLVIGMRSSDNAYCIQAAKRFEKKKIKENA